MVNETLLTSGADVPFIEAGLVVHQPTLTEIGLIGGETEFRWGCEVLNISKESLNQDMDKSVLDKIDNFDIFMKLIKDTDKNMHSLKESAINLLSILFPSYEMTIGEDALIFTKDSETHSIRKDTFPKFQQILVDICCLQSDDSQKYNPKDRVAKQIAEKFKKGRAQAALSKKDNKISILSRYASILAIGLKIDLKIPMGYTVFQLYDQYKRYQLWEINDFHIKARMAGATELEDPEDWRQDLHPDIR